MIYLFLEKNRLKLLGLKKSLMGQFETCSFDKSYQIEILDIEKINIDITASAIKEGLTEINLKEKNICLILPQEMFLFLRIKVPADIASSAIKSFIKDKATSEWQINLDNFNYDYLSFQEEQTFYINLYAINKEIVNQLSQIFKLINYQLINIFPETITYFKLFEKTLRKEKKEIILYSVLDEKQAYGFIYDNNGLIKQKRYLSKIKENLEKSIKEWIDKEISSETKISRLIISGQPSEKIRQDTFTKEVGVWTNPLKRIINGFYQEQIKLFIKKEEFSIINYDACFGAFLFDQINKNFSLLKNNNTYHLSSKSFKLPSFRWMIKKEILLFIVSFILSFAFFHLISKSKLSTPQISFIKPTITPTPTTLPTLPPTPSFNKSDLKIKILNGSGIKGLAAELKEFLKEKDYGEILIGNADSFDYKKTIIKIKKDYSQANQWLINDLKEKVNNPSFELLESTSSADIEIIIGQDFE